MKSSDYISSRSLSPNRYRSLPSGISKLNKSTESSINHPTISVFAWGLNKDGELSLGKRCVTEKVDKPTRVRGLGTIEANV